MTRNTPLLRSGSRTINKFFQDFNLEVINIIDKSVKVHGPKKTISEIQSLMEKYCSVRH